MARWWSSPCNTARISERRSWEIRSWTIGCSLHPAHGRVALEGPRPQSDQPFRSRTTTGRFGVYSEPRHVVVTKYLAKWCLMRQQPTLRRGNCVVRVAEFCSSTRYTSRTIHPHNGVCPAVPGEFDSNGHPIHGPGSQVNRTLLLSTQHDGPEGAPEHLDPEAFKTWGKRHIRRRLQVGLGPSRSRSQGRRGSLLHMQYDLRWAATGLRSTGEVRGATESRRGFGSSCELTDCLKGSTSRRE